MLVGLLALTVFVYAQPEPALAPSANEGVLHLPEGFSLKVSSHNVSEMSVESIDGRAILPIDTYRVKSWIYQKTDADGKLWKLEGYVGPIQSFTIGSEPTRLDIKPEPLKASLSVRARGDYVFYISLKGPAGETIYINGPQQSRPPSLEITNQDKSYAVTIAGKYG